MPMVGMGKMDRVVLALLSLLLVLLGMEGVVRLYSRLTLRPRGMDFDPEFGWRLLPSVRKIDRLWSGTRSASTNSHGWRDSERSYDKPPGLRRAAAVGDSLTFGMSVEDGERFTDLLQ